MTPRCPHNRSSGFGVLDLLAMIAIGLILAMLLLPSLGRGSKKRAPRLHCTSNLRQVALGIRMWADDHQDQYPFVVSASKGGSLEFAETPDVFRHFLAASNELHSPKILACPADLETRKETYWTNLSNVNVSYFVGLDAREELPQADSRGRPQYQRRHNSRRCDGV